MDFIYTYFDWIGKGILKTYPNIPDDIRSSGIHLHYEVYAALTGFIFFISVICSIISMVLLVILNLPPILVIVGAAVAVVFPVLLLVFLGLILPKSLGTSRSSTLDQEVPYAVAYLSVMSTGGMSPYLAFERLGFAAKIFSKISRLALRFGVLVRAIGWDPLTAFEDVARRNPSELIKDLVLGYAATIRAGGDVTDYLSKKSKDMFNNLIIKMRASGERMAVVLESYLAVALLVLLALNAIYLVNLSIGMVSLPGLGGGSLFLLSFIFLPYIYQQSCSSH